MNELEWFFNSIEEKSHSQQLAGNCIPKENILPAYVKCKLAFLVCSLKLRIFSTLRDLKAMIALVAFGLILLLTSTLGQIEENGKRNYFFPFGKLLLTHKMLV